MDDFWRCFVPLFVAVDFFGLLPLYLGLIEGIPRARTRRIIIQSVLTALLVSAFFLWMGPFILDFLGLTIADFLIGGGLILFILSAGDILAFGRSERKLDPEDIGAVPLGVPLMAGPAVLTTLLLLVHEYGPWPTLLALTTNIALAGLVFAGATPILEKLGKAGAKTLSKLAGLLLAAYAIYLIRKGIFLLIEEFRRTG